MFGSMLSKNGMDWIVANAVRSVGSMVGPGLFGSALKSAIAAIF